MVKLQAYKGKYFLSVPKLVIQRKKWIGGEVFDTKYDVDGNLVFEEIISSNE